MVSLSLWEISLPASDVPDLLLCLALCAGEERKETSAEAVQRKETAEKAPDACESKRQRREQALMPLSSSWKSKSFRFSRPRSFVVVVFFFPFARSLSSRFFVLTFFLLHSSLFLAPCALLTAHARVALFPRARQLERALDVRGRENRREREERRSGKVERERWRSTMSRRPRRHRRRRRPRRPLFPAASRSAPTRLRPWPGPPRRCFEAE